METHFAGTALRDLTTTFQLMHDGHGYTVTGDIHHMVEATRMHRFIQQANELALQADTMGYNVTIYFDRYTDSAFVDIRLQGDYVFYSVAAMAMPKGGMEAFSKRYHHFLSEQLTEGTLDTNTLVNLHTVRFEVERDGSLFPIDSGTIDKVNKAFFRQEKWLPGIMSGRPMRVHVTLFVIPEFVLTGHAWPDTYEWANITELTYKGVGEEPTYYTTVKSQIPPGHTVISVVYDPMSRTFRAPMVHGGSLAETERLIQELDKTSNQNQPVIIGSTGYPQRVYFFRKNQ